MAQYSKKDVLGFLATQIDIWAGIDIDMMEEDLRKLGGSLSQEDIERSKKKQEDTFNIFLFLFQLADENIPENAGFLTGDVQEAMAYFNSKRKLS